MKFSLTEVDLNGNKIGTTTIDMNITEKELEEYQNIWCDCDYLEKHPEKNAEYIENYLGTSHGWICPNCKKYVQIG